MARVPYVEAVEGESPPELVELYRDIAGLRGAVVHLYKALANRPDALRAQGLRVDRTEAPGALQ